MKPPGPVAHSEDYEVVLGTHAEFAPLVKQHHYSCSTSKTSTFAFGLYRKSDRALVGASLWLPPPSPDAARSVTPAGRDFRGVIALSRLVVVPGEPKNTAGMFLAACLRAVAADGRYHTAVTWADEGVIDPRTGEHHKGTVYKATNWTFDGRRKAHATWVDKNGCMVSEKTTNKTRTAAEMIALGYRRVRDSYKARFYIDLLPIRRRAA